MTVRTSLVLAVAAVLVVAGCTSSSTGGAGSATGSSPSVASTPTGGDTSTQASRSSSGSPTPHSTPRTSTGGSGNGPAAVHQKLSHFRIVDATFVGSQVWALGSADCLSGKGTCDAIEYSGDGGGSWRSAPAPRANIALPNHGCSGTCVGQIRFASSSVGYVFGLPDSDAQAFFMTTDGGTRWKREPGRVIGLEALDGNVIRITEGHSGCPGPCDLEAQTARVGSTSWTTGTLPKLTSSTFIGGVTFARAGGQAYLLTTANPAGGGSSERSTLWTSASDGASWTNRGEPCPQAGREVDSYQLTAAPDGSATVLCSPRGVSTQFTATSTNGGKSFVAGSKTALGSAEVTGFGAASSKVILISLADTFRSTNAGRSFARLAANAGSSPGDPPYIGFGSTTVGHAITADRRHLASTTDAGATWTLHRVP